VKLRIYSTARGISQRANGAWIYLIDEQGRRYSTNPDPSATPLTVKLGPEQSVSTSRAFEVPADVRTLGLITGHGGHEQVTHPVRRHVACNAQRRLGGRPAVTGEAGNAIGVRVVGAGPSTVVMIRKATPG
jgi:hypothetical protein